MQPYELSEDCRSAPSMADWFEQTDNCSPCILSVAVPWYVEALEENGEPSEASALSRFAQDQQNGPLKVAQEMDRVKARVGPGLSTYLKELDCTIQVNAAELT